MAATDEKTLPQLARSWGVTERRADYAARTYGVEETRRVGIIRLFDADAAARLRSAILRVAGNRRGNA